MEWINRLGEEGEALAEALSYLEAARAETENQFLAGSNIALSRSGVTTPPVVLRIHHTRPGVCQSRAIPGYAVEAHVHCRSGISNGHPRCVTRDGVPVDRRIARGIDARGKTADLIWAKGCINHLARSRQDVYAGARAARAGYVVIRQMPAAIGLNQKTREAVSRHIALKLDGLIAREVRSGKPLEANVRAARHYECRFWIRAKLVAST